MAPGDKLPWILAGTFAVHLALAAVIDAGGQFGRERVPPAIELIEIEEPPPPPPEVVPPIVPPVLPTIAPPVPTPVPPTVAPQVTRTAPRDPTPAPPDPTPPDPTPPDPTPPIPGEPGSGNGDTYRLPDGAGNGGIAVPIGRGAPGTGGGTRGGTGGGSGSGTAPAVAAPVSIASIKTPAVPRGDYSYLGAGKDYPAEARQLGIEGTLRVRLTVDARGKVTAARLLGKLGHGLDELALSRARAIEFDPAKDDQDRPVASIVVWTFHFELPT